MIQFLILILVSSSAIILFKTEIPALIAMMRLFFCLKNISLYEYQKAKANYENYEKKLDGREDKKLTSDEELEKIKNQYQAEFKDTQEQLFMLLQYSLYRASIISICAYFFFINLNQ